MSLRLKLIVAFVVVFGLGFALFGYAALRITSDAVGRELSRRIDATLEAIARHPRFFITEAEPNREQFGQVAAISGFEIVVPEADGRRVRGSSLSTELAREVLAAAGQDERFDIRVGGRNYLAARAESGGKTFFLLSERGAAERAEREIRSSVLLVASVGMGLAVVLGVLIAGGITKPLRSLAGRASLVREGRLDVDIPAGGGREVAELAGSFREMLAGLSRYRDELVKSEKMAALGQFSASVAHELRNPLSSMRMTLQLLGEGLDAEARDDVDLMLVEISRLDHSIEELLFYAGTPRYVMEEGDLRPVVEGAVDTLRPLAEHLEISLCTSLPESPVVAAHDGRKIRQAVMNLVLNAMQASPPGERVVVSARDAGGGVEVEVTDAGSGVEPSIVKRICEPFVSGRPGGTGLGLAVVAAIARAHGGSVRHGRSEGRTSFTLEVRAGG